MLSIPSLKKETKKKQIASVTDPVDFYIPLSGYRNLMEPVVKIGETVKKYQIIAAGSDIAAEKIHAPASGIINAFTTIGNKAVIHLINDFKETKSPAPYFDPSEINLEVLQEILLNCGVKGAGGSQFPTHLKYNVTKEKINTLIFNGAECEPYLISDTALMKYEIYELLQAAKVLQKVLGAPEIVFGIEKHNKSLKAHLLENAKKIQLAVKVKILPDTYPQGGELQLIKSVTKLELRKGTIPSQHGILVNNIGTLRAVYNAVFKSRPMIDRIVTVSGNNTSQSGIFRVKIGTPIGHILNLTDNHWNPEKQTVVMGGAMMGKSVDSPLQPIEKGSGGLLVLKKLKSTENNCIKCGFCIDVCPQKLMPLEFVRHNIDNDLEALRTFNLQDCIECGACAYICPSNVALMENIFEGKIKLSASAEKILQ
ncbi:RnfABCDGE type electron transport complex subunit C [Flavobacterium gelatinilyticum]|uniref:RnfABCDGE type electron transport complex subunit C n=1 Tax=Flavobacterium gelatinilyticum TaxID=3003260 RepID=UPI00248135D7|nr:RnfABCDGE type electron transport complex subunit C [Flavobacterium gelatinilyticum]